MGRYILRRLGQAIPTLIGILVLTFALTRLSPSDPIQLMLGGQYDITPEDRIALRESLGLNDPLPVQFAKWVWNVAHLDFGNSFYYQRPVMSLILERVPNSLQISLAALIVTIAVGIPLGILAALRRGTLADHGIRVFSVGGHAIPQFWLGLMFVLTFGVRSEERRVGKECRSWWRK